MPAKLQSFSIFAAICLTGCALWWIVRRKSPSAAAEIEDLKNAALRRGDSLSWRFPAVSDGD